MCTLQHCLQTTSEQLKLNLYGFDTGKLSSLCREMILQYLAILLDVSILLTQVSFVAYHSYIIFFRNMKQHHTTSAAIKLPNQFNGQTN